MPQIRRKMTSCTFKRHELIHSSERKFKYDYQFILCIHCSGIVGLSVFPDFHLYLTNYLKTYIYAHHQNGLNGEIKIMCFVVSTYISRVINENVRKVAKTKTIILNL